MQIKNFRHNSVNFKFSNGNSIDAIFGYGTYSDNYDKGEFDKFAENGSSTVESIISCSEKLQKKIYKKYSQGDIRNPLSYIPVDDWLEIAILIKREKNDTSNTTSKVR